MQHLSTSEHPRTSSSDHFPRAAALIMAVTSLLFAQPKCNRISALSTSSSVEAPAGVRSRLCTEYLRQGQTPNLLVIYGCLRGLSNATEEMMAQHQIYLRPCTTLCPAAELWVSVRTCHTCSILEATPEVTQDGKLQGMKKTRITRETEKKITFSNQKKMYLGYPIALDLLHTSAP